MNGIPPIGVCLILLLSLALSPLSAQITERPVQLCGSTQFLDTVLIDATVREGGELIIASRYIQRAANLYTLFGVGPFIRNPNPPLDHFIGGLNIVNPSQSFDANPRCTATVDIADDNPSIPSYVGTAVLLCTDGPNFPFQVTLNMILLNCSDTGFPGAAASAQASENLIAAGAAQNNEYVVK